MSQNANKQVVVAKKDECEGEHNDKNANTKVGFTKFSILPREIQLMIWEFATAAEPPQKIQVQFIDERNLHDGVKAIYKIPAILQTCRASRMIALKTYRPSFGDKLQDEPVYFNKEKDEMIYASSWAIRFFEDHEDASAQWFWDEMYLPEQISWLDDTEILL